jgi:hypothetical protein
VLGVEGLNGNRVWKVGARLAQACNLLHEHLPGESALVLEAEKLGRILPLTAHLLVAADKERRG